MKDFLQAIAALALLLCGALAQAAPPDARLKLPEFSTLEDKATEVVNITLDKTLLGMAARFLDGSKPEDKAAKEIIAGLVGVYVQSYSFDRDFAYPIGDVERLRKQLSAPGWQRVVETRSRKERTQVDIYLCIDGPKACGLAIIASEPREFTIVNIVGAVDLEKLHHLEGKLGIPKLDIQSDDKDED